MGYADAVSRLEPLRFSGDLDRLEKVVADIEPELSRGRAEDYFRFMLYVCDMLSSHDFKNYGRQMELLHKDASAALRTASSISPEAELQALTHLQEDFEEVGTTPEQWATKRKERASQWLNALRKLDDEIDEKFDFTDVPVVNVAPPSRAQLPSGVAPEHVKNLAQRKNYQAAIKKNQQKAEQFARQWQLRELHKRYWSAAVDYLKRAYTRPPLSHAELQQLLQRHVRDPKTKREVLDAVQSGPGI